MIIEAVDLIDLLKKCNPIDVLVLFISNEYEN